MRTIINDFFAGMENTYNSFFISFLALKVLGERPLWKDYIIPIEGFSFNVLKAYQLNSVQIDSIYEYVNSIRRHMLNDIVLCYERYATTMYASISHDMVRTDPAKLDDRKINSSRFEEIPQLYTDEEKNFFKQLRHLRNSIVHYNGVFSMTNPIDYTFHKDTYFSEGHEGESITIELDSIMFIYYKVKEIVERVNHSFFEKCI